jgi:histidinol dehydrogenase
MDIRFYTWRETDQRTKDKIFARAQADISRAEDIVRPIIEDVRLRGDDALRDYALKFDGAKVEDLKCTEAEFNHAENLLEDDLKQAIRTCAENVRLFHEEQMRRVEEPWMMEVKPGVFAGERVNLIESVGLYIPRGKGAFPSAMYMLCLPAVIAGVENIAVVTPPTPEGTADAASLFTARLCGVEQVYKVGGAQAIAALAYGTKTVPRVRKTLGPGSPYVAAAKRLLSDIIDPGMPAGPSEAIILCDDQADPHNTCLDVLNEAEHGKDSAALLITHDSALASYVRTHIGKLIEHLPHPHRDICTHVMQNYGGIILTESLEQSIDISNIYAPEHLHLKVKNPDAVVPQLKHAGEILIGEYTPPSLGNYGIGINHVLPTSGFAHTYSCTTVWDFLKRTSVSRCTKAGFESLIQPVTTLTDYEGFPAHGDALRKRNV